MWNGTTVVLVRFATSDAITLRAGDWADLLKMALRDRVEKARRILDGKMILVKGKDCYECPIKNADSTKITTRIMLDRAI